MKTKYFKLFNLSNSILNDRNSGSAIQAISFLNNIKIDSYQKKKLDLVWKKNILYFYFLLIINFLKFLFKFLIYITTPKKKFFTKKKILFINTFNKKNNIDIYFKHFLKFKKIKKDNLNLFIQPFSLFNNLTNQNLIPFKNLNFSDEIQIIKEFWTGFIFLIKKYFKEKNHIKKKLIMISISYLFSGDTYLTLRICYSLRIFVLKNKIKKL